MAVRQPRSPLEIQIETQRALEPCQRFIRIFAVLFDEILERTGLDEFQLVFRIFDGADGEPNFGLGVGALRHDREVEYAVMAVFVSPNVVYKNHLSLQTLRRNADVFVRFPDTNIDGNGNQKVRFSKPRRKKFAKVKSANRNLANAEPARAVKIRPMRWVMVVLVLALISGTVAYIGDVAGRWVAKKRMALFGVRPRRAGAVVAVMTGVVIALVSFGLLSLLSRDIRKWVYEYDKLMADLSELRLQYENASQANEALKAAAERITQDLNDGRMELDTVKTELSDVSARLEQTGESLVKSRSDLGEITSKLQANEKQLSETQSRLKTAGEKEKELEKDISALESDNKTLKQSREELKTEIEKLESESAELEVRTKELEAEEVRLSSTVENLAKQLGDLKSKNILIGAKQPLAYISIDNEWTGQQVREAIISTLGALRQKLASKGYMLEITPAQELDTLHAQLSLAAVDEVIIVYSKENVVPDQPVRVGYFIIPNRLCFKKDEIVSSFRVPPNTSGDKVEEMFANSIREMREKADERNLLPDIDKGTVGSVNYEEIKRLISRISWKKEAFEVFFVVTEDVYALGNLDNLQIKARAVK